MICLSDLDKLKPNIGLSKLLAKFNVKIEIIDKITKVIKKGILIENF